MMRRTITPNADLHVASVEGERGKLVGLRKPIINGQPPERELRP